MKKNSLILYIIGALIAAAGFAMLIFGFKLIGIITFVSGIVIFAGTFVSVKLIGESKNATNDTADDAYSLENKINLSITQTRQDRFRAESEIRKIRMWAEDTIIATYGDLFPQANLAIKRDDLVERYEGIKEQFGNKLSYEMMDKCDTVVKGFLNQIKLEESKILLYDKLNKEYTETKDKLRIAKQNTKKMSQLDKQENRMKELEGTSMANALAAEYSLEDVKKDVELQQEYYKQLEQLKFQYGDTNNAANAQAFQNEIDKIIGNIK